MSVTDTGKGRQLGVWKRRFSEIQAERWQSTIAENRPASVLNAGR